MTSILTDVFPSSLYLGALQLCRKVSVFPECQSVPNYIIVVLSELLMEFNRHILDITMLGTLTINWWAARELNSAMRRYKLLVVNQLTRGPKFYLICCSNK